jgi:hypothetical protein
MEFWDQLHLEHKGRCWCSVSNNDYHNTDQLDNCWSVVDSEFDFWTGMERREVYGTNGPYVRFTVVSGGVYS